ncbi:MAG: hypothetical protein ACRBFS_08110 [Aureispira sp.]
MKKITFLVLISIIFYNCSNYKNKINYKTKVGEIVEIYDSTNSCCYYCLSNEKDLKHIKLMERKTIDEPSKDCDGCNHTEAFVFKTESIGIDTVELKLLEATMECDNNGIESKKYIIEIK